MKKVLRREEGFTLIEIIAVLVILGVLAAVAVPKYLTLMQESKEKAATGALAAALSNVTMQYGSQLLNNTDEPSAFGSAIAECNNTLTDLGDYTAVYSGGSTASTGTVSIYVSKTDDATASAFTASAGVAIY